MNLDIDRLYAILIAERADARAALEYREAADSPANPMCAARPAETAEARLRFNRLDEAVKIVDES